MSIDPHPKQSGESTPEQLVDSLRQLIAALAEEPRLHTPAELHLLANLRQMVGVWDAQSKLDELTEKWGRAPKRRELLNALCGERNWYAATQEVFAEAFPGWEE